MSSAPPDVTVPFGRADAVLVVGSGLIGTSLAMALRARGIAVSLTDTDARAQSVALERSGASPWSGETGFELTVICTPPQTTAVALALAQRQKLSQSFSDVASYKADVLAEAEALGCDMATVIGGHPFAGRERGGPENAHAELFADRPWVLCPTPWTSADALLSSRRLVEAVGAVPVVTSAARHDAAAAWLSHLPQLLASALAAGAADIGERELGLAGQGFKDLTRIADSPPELWRHVVAGNATEIRRALAKLLSYLEPLVNEDSVSASSEDYVSAASSDADASAVNPGHDPGRAPHGPAAETVGDAAAALVRAGNDGRSMLPSKAGRAFLGETVVVVVRDQPGELARLLGDAAAASVNIEDVHVQHGAAGTRGLVDLDVAPRQGRRLVDTLTARGWHCWSPMQSDS